MGLLEELENEDYDWEEGPKRQASGTTWEDDPKNKLILVVLLGVLLVPVLGLAIHGLVRAILDSRDISYILGVIPSLSLVLTFFLSYLVLTREAWRAARGKSESAFLQKGGFIRLLSLLLACLGLSGALGILLEGGILNVLFGLALCGLVLAFSFFFFALSKKDLSSSSASNPVGLDPEEMKPIGIVVCCSLTLISILCIPLNWTDSLLLNLGVVLAFGFLAAFSVLLGVFGVKSLDEGGRDEMEKNEEIPHDEPVQKT
jgi:hypothetical protein